ncbi:MAG: hypothetical protein NTU41_13970 [Chloroflexi bacterium]|nr:hypothetical protein [Chloroflexota bacterium]
MAEEGMRRSWNNVGIELQLDPRHSLFEDLASQETVVPSLHCLGQPASATQVRVLIGCGAHDKWA